MAGLAATDPPASSRRVTIKDIARSAGVSVTTVSDSLSGNGRLPAETRQRVRQLAKDLGYRPSAAARSLVGSRTGLLLMSVAAPDTPTSALWSIDFFTNLMISAAGRAAIRGFVLALSPASVPPNLSYDGAIVVDPTSDSDLLAEAAGEAVPIVTVGRSPQGHPWVDNDYPTIVPNVLAHLQSCGAQRPVLLASDPATSYVRDTAEQYTLWCSEHGCRPHIVYVDAGISQIAGHDAAARLLRGDYRPDAVLTTLDQLAMGVIAAVEELGWSVPGDVRVASLGDSAMIAHSRVPITAVDLSPDELGRRAVDMLIDQIEGTSTPTNCLLPGQLLVRASTQGVGSAQA